jgi:RNA polymerase sigma-70 factor (ECF subfamily)
MGGQQARFPETLRNLSIDDIARLYWKPIYAYIRLSWAKSNEDAKDLTQAFLLWLVEGDALQKYAPDKASFRTYLKSLLKHFVGHQHEAQQRLKRGGGIDFVDLPLDLQGDPDQAFDREWLSALVQRAIERVRGTSRFEVFEAYDLVPPDQRPTYAELAKRFGLDESQIRKGLAAIREAVRNEIRAELAGDVESEWKALLEI